MALSLDLRERLIRAYEKGEGSIRELAKRFSVGAASVFRLLKRHHEGKDIHPVSPPGRHPLIDERGLKLISELLAENNDATLEELCKRYEKQTKLRVAIVTMHRACKRLKLSYKKNSISC
jgi:transposase